MNDDRTTTDQWFPNVVVSPPGDRLGIFYYSRQEDTANNNLYRYYSRIGAISGATVSFGPGFAVSETPSFPEVGRDGFVDRTITATMTRHILGRASLMSLGRITATICPVALRKRSPTSFSKTSRLGCL